MLKNSFITKVYVDTRWLVIFYSLSKSVKCFVKVLRKAGIAVCLTVKWLKYYIIIQTKYYHFSGYEELTLGWDPLYNPVQLQMPFRSPPVSNQPLTSTKCLWEQKQSKCLSCVRIYPYPFYFLSTKLWLLTLPKRSTYFLTTVGPFITKLGFFGSKFVHSVLVSRNILFPTACTWQVNTCAPLSVH